MSQFNDDFLYSVERMRNTANALRTRVSHGSFIPSTRTERTALLSEITTLRGLVRACDATKVSP